ncbi:hypothetical protein COCOR_07960 [Corallococcus coralloides DSM 2259]|uniref:Uncharacterized protein n=1 Tax=Corallococcus coralloides (strain ATCC 25202 / DSM 2259 / NBRC 100086 / M2) TaxID=1144275 RepID=H8MXZ2_CORCM|nr:hypothetical protein [Corallococcus coralloides]AFE07842.1 hypothetical protein COCOR_07960 [Corallococcus coralloides DSM 2259]
MATNDTRPAPTQPAEDFYGRPTTPRQDGEPQRSRPEEEDERKPRRELTEADEKGIRPRTEDDVDDRDLSLHDASGVHPYDPRERAPGAALDDIPDGDGPRSDAGTNPVTDVYRYGHPDRILDRIPDRER